MVVEGFGTDPGNPSPVGRSQKKLADDISKELGLPLRIGRRFLQRLIDEIANDLVYTDRIELRGLGTFQVHDRQGHTTYHPKTGEAVYIEERKVVDYRSSVELRRRLNGEELAENP